MNLTQPPPEASPDWTIPQNWQHYIVRDHATWDTLFSRQVRLLRDLAAPEFLRGLDLLRLARGGIPDFDELSDILMKATGWQVVAVPGLIPDEVFFDHLANRRFVAGNFIRSPGQLDYLQEPDVFHDVFGHVPLLADPMFADYMQAYGKGGQRAQGLGAIERLARLYWYTVEFGLVRTDRGPRLYGAGIVSSRSESIFAIHDPSPNHLAFDVRRMMRTKYRIDDFQETYFVIENFEDLLDKTLNTDFLPLYEELSKLPDFEPDEIVAGDCVYQWGTQVRPKRESR